MSNKGQSLIELAVGLTILVPIVLILVDLVVLLFGMELNVGTCREAARIAASGDPTTVSSRVMSVVLGANGHSSGMINNFRIVNVQLNPSDLLTQAASLQPYGGTIPGAVTVSIAADIHPFVVQWICAGGQPFTVTSSQSFPFTYVVPNTANTLPASPTPPSTIP